MAVRNASTIVVSPRRIPLLVIGGPTATGKTEAALRVCEAMDAEIVSADSMQIYRYMDIGTAKPTMAERSRARLHLIDFVDPREAYTVAQFQSDASKAILKIFDRGKLPVLCGGTGLYIRSVVQHLTFPPDGRIGHAEVRAALKARLDAEGIERLHEELRRVDAEAAENIKPLDAKRIIRALEVIAITGHPFAPQQRIDEAPAVDYNSTCFVVSRPRDLLYDTIEQRVNMMLEMGWLDEVRGLKELGCSNTDQAMQAIGYRHLLAFIEDDADFAQTVEVIKRDTRRFAKRQETWFRKEIQLALTRETNKPRSMRFEWSTLDDFDTCVTQITEAARVLLGKASDAKGS